MKLIVFVQVGSFPCLPSIIDVLFETVSRIFRSIFNYRELNFGIHVQFCVT